MALLTDTEVAEALAQFRVEDARAEAVARAQGEYRRLVQQLEAIELATELVLTCANTDYENCLEDYPDTDTEMFWRAMLLSASMAAGDRAAEQGYDINALVGRNIY